MALVAFSFLASIAFSVIVWCAYVSVSLPYRIGVHTTYAAKPMVPCLAAMYRKLGSMADPRLE